MFIRTASVELLDVIDVNKPDSIFKYGGLSAYEDEDNRQKLVKAIKIAKLDNEFLPVIYVACHGDVPNNKGDLFRWGSYDNPDEPELLRYDPNEWIGVPNTPTFRKGGRVYETFIGKGFYKEHHNYDPSLSVGFLADAIPNDRIKGIEVLAMIDRVKDPALCRSIEAGYSTAASMGASVQEAICSICGNKARNVSELCIHSKRFKGRHYSGPETNFTPKLCYDDNRGVHFIELSAVAVPADPLAHKVAILKSASGVQPMLRDDVLTGGLKLIDRAVTAGDIGSAHAIADRLVDYMKTEYYA